MSIAHLADLADPGHCPRLVIKVGSALLVGNGRARREWLASLVGEIAAARGRGQQVIVVSSGAIALGAAKLGLEKGGRASLADAQAAAAVGQIGLAGLWAELHHAPALAAQRRLLGGFLILQVLTGLSNVVLDWPLVAAVLHTGGAAALVTIVVWCLAVTRADANPQRA